MNQLFITLALKALCAVLCQFCDCCKDNEECPDGVCDDLLQAVDDMDASTGAPMSRNPQAIDMDIDWSKIREVIDAGTVFINAIMAFLGLNKVGR